MATIETTAGEVEEELLERRPGVLDNAVEFGHIVDYHLKATGERVRRDASYYFRKVCPFEAPVPEQMVEIEEAGQRLQVPAFALTRTTGFVDNATEYTWWEEFRRVGSDAIVKRSADVKKKFASEGATAQAGQAR